MLPDTDEVLISWDHDNIEGRIHDLILNDTVALQAHKEGLDLHTITTCNIFGYALPPNLKNPHTYCDCDPVQKGTQNDLVPLPLCVHCQWRKLYHWQGKDTKQRVLAKNFNHGSKYSRTYTFVHKIKGIEKYGVSRTHLEQLAKRYIESKGDSWQRKLDIMQDIQRKRIARTLYGGRRIFFDSSEETGREGFSHMISGTVSDYNNLTLINLHEALGKQNVRLLHNAHDGDKIAVKRQYIEAWFGSNAEFIDSIKPLIERDITYEGRTITLTAGVKVHEHR
jgi:DNA polymerase I-like protein with 3'-5' exonuclease and polymerase domains